MMGKTLSVIFALIAALGLCACSGARPVPSGDLAREKPYDVEPIAGRSSQNENLDRAKVQEIRALNKKAGSPTFGMIKAFYQLPRTSPGGAIQIEEAYGPLSAYRSITLTDLESQPFALSPLSPQQSDVMIQAMNDFLDAGVKFVDVSMADAVKVMRAEQQAMDKKRIIFPSRSVPPGVDLLISTQKGHTEAGPVYLGRVIRTKDGRLIALRSEPDQGVYSLRPLLKRLVMDSIQRLSEEAGK